MEQHSTISESKEIRHTISTKEEFMGFLHCTAQAANDMEAEVEAQISHPHKHTK